jgi:hypothetical protein
MAKLTVTTHHHSVNVHEIEVEEDFALPSADKDWFTFSGKDGAKLSVHERNVSAISLSK